MTATLLALTPGPDVLLVIATAAKSGFKSAFKLVLGFATGCVFHTLLMVAGVTVLIAKTGWAIQVITVLGACYLMYLAYQTWRHRSDQLKVDEVVAEPDFMRGVIMNISNPKVLLFFLALFPQFANLSEPGAESRLLVLGLIFALVTVVVFGALAWLTAKSLSAFFYRPKFKWWMDRFCVLIFAGLSVLMLSSLFFISGQ